MNRIVLMISTVAVLVALSGCSHVPQVLGADGKPVPGSVSTREKVRLGGTDQWIYVKGYDADNPVLLWLDGGPGGSELAWVRKYLGPLHERFTIVCWDQRGTARSWGAVKNRKKLRVEDYVSDTIELSALLAKRFGKEKIYLSGHSWGSIIGVMAAAERPDLYAAYIGTGQQVNSAENDIISWEMVREGARREGKVKLVKKLEKNGRPPYTVEEKGKYMDFFKHIYRYSPRSPVPNAFDSMWILRAPEQSLIDKLNLVRGLIAGVEYVYPQLADLDFERDVQALDCPVFIVNGRYDYTCVAAIAERWFGKLSAPVKDLVWFENSGHNACYEEADRFMSYMTGVVLARTAR